MKKINTVLMSAVALAVSSNIAMAAAAAPDFIDGLDKSFAVTSNHVFRGLSVSDEMPAVQGGATYNHASGLSVDFWLSSSSAGSAGSASNEYDITVKYGKKTKDFSFEAGLVSYSFPQTGGASEGTHEYFAGIQVNNINAAIFINPDSLLGDNTYIELSVDIDKFNLALGINSNDFVPADYNQVTASVALTKQLELAVSQTDLDFDDTQWALTYSMPIK
ncbi:MAG: TorF family putative porin [Gammaproteobacteria bacterium]|nr:TorF family putative porin [Gammaproteobacteria bacterium]